MAKMFPYRSKSEFARANLEVAGVPYSDVIFYSPEADESKVACPWSKEVGTCYQLSEVHLVKHLKDGRIIGSQPGERWEVLCQSEPEPRLRETLPPVYTVSDIASTCFECRRKAGLPVLIPEEG